MNLSGKRLLLPGVLSLIFIYFLFKSLGEVDVLSVLRRLNPTYLILAFLFYLVVSFSRSLRIRSAYSGEDYPLRLIFSVSNLHTFLSNVFPSRLGEVSFVVLMRKVFGEHLGRNTVALIFFRIMDTFVVSSFFIVAAIIVGLSTSAVGPLWFYFVLVVLLGLLSFYLDTLVVLGVSVVKGLVSWAKLGKVGMGEKLLGFLDTLATFKILRSKGIYGRNVFFTVVIWVFLMLVNKSVTMSLGIDLSWPLLVFSSTGAVLTSLIPITTFAAVGTYELGWIGVFALVGLSKEQAILTGLTIHTVNFLFSLLLGVVGFLVISKCNKE